MTRTIILALILASFWTTSVSAETAWVSTEDRLSGSNVVYYTVKPGDNIGSIALKFGSGVGELKAWNKLENPEVTPGEQIIVRSDEKVKVEPPKAPLPVIHIVKKGETFESIAKKYKVSVAQLTKWNRKTNPRKLQIGQKVTLHIPGRGNNGGVTMSSGKANRGRLYNGVAMHSVPGMRVRNVARAYGTQDVINLLEAAGYDIKARWPDAPDLEVGDLSFKSGGRMKPHKSHQSGRDVDLSYYHRGNVPVGFRKMTLETFDAAKNWHILKTLIDTGRVEYIFVDYQLQKKMHEYALSIGYQASDLEGLLQYPNAINSQKGVIRHSKGHADHWHIRFKCGSQDRSCQ